jgi:hypothetical protein
MNTDIKVESKNTLARKQMDAKEANILFAKAIQEFLDAQSEDDRLRAAQVIRRLEKELPDLLDEASKKKFVNFSSLVNPDRSHALYTVFQDSVPQSLSAPRCLVNGTDISCNLRIPGTSTCSLCKRRGKGP